MLEMVISDKLRVLAEKCERELAEVFSGFDAVARVNTERVLQAFSELKLSDRHFAPTTGYGYDDDGRELCDKAFASVFGAESGFVRHSIVSGTHALGIGLYALLRPADTMLSVTGAPYDTLEGVLGYDTEGNAVNDGSGSLADFGVKYSKIELLPDEKGGGIDFDAVKHRLVTDKSIKVVYVQRSKGYATRKTLSVPEIDELFELVRSVSNAFLVVDNCYGEFVEEREPKADLLIGSLIKNPGGGIAESGAYLVGTKRAVDLAAARLTVPAIGLECGASLGQTKGMIKGLFFAPHAVAQALKTAAFASALFKKLGYKVSPEPLEKRYDIIQTVSLAGEEEICAFCRGLQSGSPVDSYVAPEPWDMPGYNDRVVMAAGAFTQGSSLELSADAPIRPPFTVFIQGGLTYESGRYGVLKAAQAVIDNN
ncbi:MAG: methionine gamma-lyase family protein [Clostridia bacterium]|nr:methionine gamma-lyase family protein [Clostridia bacterium]